MLGNILDYISFIHSSRNVMYYWHLSIILTYQITNISKNIGFELRKSSEFYKQYNKTFEHFTVRSTRISFFKKRLALQIILFYLQLIFTIFYTSLYYANYWFLCDFVRLFHMAIDLQIGRPIGFKVI